VLLGDVVEFRQGPVRDALAAASRVLAALAQALPSGREVVIVPGNHDHYLLDGWLMRRSAAGPPPPLGLASEVDAWGGEPLAEIVRVLEEGGASVRASYPGVWLREDVWATHGHYIDRHTTVPMFERLAVGGMARALRRPAEEARSAEDYEAVLAPIYALIHAAAQSARSAAAGAPGASAQAWEALGRGVRGGGLRRRALLGGLGGAVAVLNRAGIGPLRADLTQTELRRAGLRAFGQVLESLSVRCDYAVFGHTHRAGPRAHDRRSEWVAPTGARILNTGCWVHEPAFLGPDPQRSPYRAGFAVSLRDAGPPELINLLD